MLDSYPRRMHKKLKPRGRKGIPDGIRGWAWCLLVDANTQMSAKKQKLSLQQKTKGDI